MERILLVATLMLSAAWLRGAQNTPDAMLGAALHQEEVQGDLKGAIAAYQRILAMPGVSAAIAAQAILHIAECYEKLGDSQSLMFYERVVREFGDQREAATIARAKLEKSRAPRFVDSAVAIRPVLVRTDQDPLGSISTDGRYLSFVNRTASSSELMLRDLSTGQTRILAKGSVGRSLFSPESKQVVYSLYNEGAFELRVVAVNGSGDRAVYRRTRASDNVTSILPVGWPAGGNVLAMVGFTDRSSAITWISLVDGKGRTVTTPHNLSSNSRVAVSPDARYIAYEGIVPGSTRNAIYVMSSSGDREFPLVDSRWQDRVLTWLPNSKGLLFSSDRTRAVAVWIARVKDGIPDGTPILVKDNLGQSLGLSVPFSMDAIGITSKGSLFYTLSSSASEMFVADIDPLTGKVRGRPSAVGPSNDVLNVLPAWSPDSSQLAYHSILARLANELSPRLLHIYYSDSRSQRDLNPNIEYLGHKLAWFPDSRSLLLWGLSADGKHNLYKVDASSGKAEVVAPLDVGPGFLALSRDGNTAYYV